MAGEALAYANRQLIKLVREHEVNPHPDQGEAMQTWALVVEFPPCEVAE